MKNKAPKYTLSADDVDALLLSLPLVNEFSDFCRSELQAEINAGLVFSTTQKLCAAAPLTLNEIRVACASCIAALDCISGTLSADLSPDRKADLSKYFFTYNKLKSQFQQIMDAHAYLMST